MKTAVTVLAIAALCVCAWAAGSAVVGTSPEDKRGTSPISSPKCVKVVSGPLPNSARPFDTRGRLSIMARADSYIVTSYNVGPLWQR